MSDGSVVTDFVVDSRAVPGQLKGVQQIQVSGGAVAAILSDGLVVAWGDQDYGGVSGAVQGQLRRAADPSLLSCFCSSPDLTWGDADFGGDSCAVQGQLKGVQQIQAS